MVYHSPWSFLAQKTSRLLHSATSSSRPSACSTCLRALCLSLSFTFPGFWCTGVSIDLPSHLYLSRIPFLFISIDCISSSTCRVAPFSWSFLSFWLLHPFLHRHASQYNRGPSVSLGPYTLPNNVYQCRTHGPAAQLLYREEPHFPGIQCSCALKKQWQIAVRTIVLPSTDKISAESPKDPLRVKDPGGFPRYR